jgi:hypothetical protein
MHAQYFVSVASEWEKTGGGVRNAELMNNDEDGWLPQ